MSVDHQIILFAGVVPIAAAVLYFLLKGIWLENRSPIETIKTLFL